MGAETPFSQGRPGLFALIRREALLPVSVATSFAFFRWGDSLFDRLSSPSGQAVIFLWLFTVVLASALNVVRHAEALAERLGEPYGALILTLSVTFIEVMSISAVMLHGDNNPTLVRDTLFAVVMIILNGMVGLSLFVGAWRHRTRPTPDPATPGLSDRSSNAWDPARRTPPRACDCCERAAPANPTLGLWPIPPSPCRRSRALQHS